MSTCMESLERRTLLSASPDQLSSDLQQIQTDGPSILGDVFSCHGTMVADFKATAGDLRALPHTSANRALAAALRAAQDQWISTFLRDYHALIRAGLPSGRRAGKDGTALFNDTSDTAAASRLLADLKTLQQRTAAPLAAFLADMPRVTSALTARLAAAASANSASAGLQTHATTETTDVNNCLATLQTDANTAQTDVATLVNDLSA